MGVVVSTASTTSPFFLASGIIGFVSFAFTLATLLKVLWVNFETLGQAEHEVHAYLTNLRTELLEERASLRAMKKNCRRQHRETAGRSVEGKGTDLDEVTLKTMSDAIRHLIRRFKDVERPFLEPGEQGIGEVTSHSRRRRRRSEEDGSPYYRHSVYASPPEKSGRTRPRNHRDAEARLPHYAQDDDDDDEESPYWAQRCQYANYSLSKRIHWLYKKSEAQQLFETLSRVQIRRVARQVGAISVAVHEYGGGLRETSDMVRRIDERMSRFVGVRRIEEGKLHRRTTQERPTAMLYHLFALPWELREIIYELAFTTPADADAASVEPMKE